LTQYFVKRPPIDGKSQWDVYYRINGKPVTNPVDGATKLEFNGNGSLVSDSGATVFFADIGSDSSPAAHLSFSIDYANSTQFGGPFSPNFTQDGYATGEYAGLSIGSDGSIMANYTNGESK